MPIVGESWKKQIDKDILLLQAGTVAGLKQYTELLFDRALADGFVEGATKEVSTKSGKISVKLETAETNLYSSPRVRMNRKGVANPIKARRIYAKNKVVSRTGELRDAFVLGSWTGNTAASKRPDCHVKVEMLPNPSIRLVFDGNAEIRLSQFNGRKTREHKLTSEFALPGTPTRRPIVERANAKVSRFFKSVMKKHIDLQLKKGSR